MFIRSCPFLTPAVGTKIDIKEELGDNNNNLRLKFQAEQTEGLEGDGIKIIVRKQAQTMNDIIEGI